MHVSCSIPSMKIKIPALPLLLLASTQSILTPTENLLLCLHRKLGRFAFSADSALVAIGITHTLVREKKLLKYSHEFCKKGLQNSYFSAQEMGVYVASQTPLVKACPCGCALYTQIHTLLTSVYLVKYGFTFRLNAVLVEWKGRHCCCVLRLNVDMVRKLHKQCCLTTDAATLWSTPTTESPKQWRTTHFCP